MAKQGYKVMDSDIHLLRQRSKPRLRGTFEAVTSPYRATVVSTGTIPVDPLDDADDEGGILGSSEPAAATRILMPFRETG